MSKDQPKAVTSVNEAVPQEETAEPQQSIEARLKTAPLREAIEIGKAIIKDGKSKADAARAMYERISAEDKLVVVAAFVKGAGLTEKGALTYWYNCKRRLAKASTEK